jgi:hypothetical protein
VLTNGVAGVAEMWIAGLQQSREIPASVPVGSEPIEFLNVRPFFGFNL